MKIKYLISFIVIIFALAGSAYLANKVLAQGTASAADIQYPVKELGGCKNETDCRSYCDTPAHSNACFDFAQKNNLMSDEEIQQAKRFLAAGSKGPGDCRGKDACESYCNDISNIDECVSYAEKNNLMSAQDLEEAKKVQAAIAQGVKPPNCRNKKECEVYCDDPNYMEECITFGAAAGFIQGKDLENSQKMLQAIKKGVKPLSCRGREACDVYCSEPDNMEVCINFAVEAGFMNDEEKADSQKILQAIRKGIKPPNCKTREECDTYCSQEQNFQECTNFAEAAGFMTSEEVAMARKTGGKGPSGCVGKDTCDTFCNNPDNQETCFNFAKDNGMMSEEDLKNMEEGKQRMKQSLEQASAEVLDCLKTDVGANMVEKMKNGVMPPREIGDKMQTCFQKIGPSNLGEPGAGGMIPPAGQAGPGGCKTAKECINYCESNPDKCKNFGSNRQENQQGPPNNNIEERIPQYKPCEGENCQYGPPREPQSGQQPPPSLEQQPQQPVPSENPPPPL